MASAVTYPHSANVSPPKAASNVASAGLLSTTRNGWRRSLSTPRRLRPVRPAAIPFTSGPLSPGAQQERLSRCGDLRGRQYLAARPPLPAVDSVEAGADLERCAVRGRAVVPHGQADRDPGRARGERREPDDLVEQGGDLPAVHPTGRAAERRRERAPG